MAEPELFPSQPNPQEHVEKHKDSTKKEELPIAGSQLNVVATRLKILEERYSTLRKKSQTTEHNIIEVEKNHYDDLRIINDDITDIKHKIRDLTDKLTLLHDEIQNFAAKKEFEVLEKFFDFWQPVDFVTRKEVNDFLRKRFKESPAQVPKKIIQKEKK